jgi:hypothetical protein
MTELTFTEQYRADLDASGQSWTDHVVKEWPECDHPEHQGNTWLRHVPTGVLIHHHGRSEAGTLAHLADLLGQHRMITEEERAAAHGSDCDCGPGAHPVTEG